MADSGLAGTMMSQATLAVVTGGVVDVEGHGVGVAETVVLVVGLAVAVVVGVTEAVLVGVTDAVVVGATEVVVVGGATDMVGAGVPVGAGVVTGAVVGAVVGVGVTTGLLMVVVGVGVGATGRWCRRQYRRRSATAAAAEAAGVLGAALVTGDVEVSQALVRLVELLAVLRVVWKLVARTSPAPRPSTATMRTPIAASRARGCSSSCR